VVQGSSRKLMNFSFLLHLLDRWSISRPPGRERIETPCSVARVTAAVGISRPPGRERIETVRPTGRTVFR